jgi:hypothetical protein
MANVRVVDVAWPDGLNPAQGGQGRLVGSDKDGVGKGETLAYHFVVPDNIGPGAGWMSVVEHTNASGQGVPVPYQGSLSQTPGDLTGGIVSFNDEMDPFITFRGAASAGKPDPVLTPGDWYFNISPDPSSGVAFSGTKFQLYIPRLA